MGENDSICKKESFPSFSLRNSRPWSRSSPMGTGLFRSLLSGSPGSALYSPLRSRYQQMRQNSGPRPLRLQPQEPGISLLSRIFFPMSYIECDTLRSAFPIMAVIADQMAMDPMPPQDSRHGIVKKGSIGPRTGAKRLHRPVCSSLLAGIQGRLPA